MVTEKLTGKVIDKLTVYCDFVKNMYKAIWASYFHNYSIDQNPHHDKCQIGEDSWCSWQKTRVMNTFSSYKQDYQALPPDVATAIFPIHEDLSNEKLLERCVGGFTQNNNESYNQLIWKVSPKIVPSGSNIVEIAAYIALF